MQAQRQPGSAFKPFVYTAAMDNGFQPTDIIVDAPVSFPGGRTASPTSRSNYDHKYRGPGHAALRAAAVDQHPGDQAAAQGGHLAGGELRAAHGHHEPVVGLFQALLHDDFAGRLNRATADGIPRMAKGGIVDAAAM